MIIYFRFEGFSWKSLHLHQMKFFFFLIFEGRGSLKIILFFFSWIFFLRISEFKYTIMGKGGKCFEAKLLRIAAIIFLSFDNKIKSPTVHFFRVKSRWIRNIFVLLFLLLLFCISFYIFPVIERRYCYCKVFKSDQFK